MRHLSNRVKRNSEANEESGLGWDAMIRDAKKRIEDLKFSIQVFEKRRQRVRRVLRNPHSTIPCSNTVFKTVPNDPCLKFGAHLPISQIANRRTVTFGAKVTRITTVRFSSGARSEKSWKPVPALLGN